MDAEAEIRPALDDAGKSIGEAVEMLRLAAINSDLQLALDGGLVANARARFADALDIVEQRLSHGQTEPAWYALARAAEFAGYCRGVDAAHFAAQEEVRRRDAKKAHLANESRRDTTSAQNAGIADAVAAMPKESPAWRDWVALESAIRVLMAAHKPPIRDTPGRVRAICQDPRLVPIVQRLKPARARRPNRKAPSELQDVLVSEPGRTVHPSRKA